MSVCVCVCVCERITMRTSVWVRVRSRRLHERTCVCMCACVCACVCVCVRALLTSWLTWPVHGDLYGPVVSGHLRRVGEYGDCQGEALAYEGNIKRRTHTHTHTHTHARTHTDTDTRNDKLTPENWEQWEPFWAPSHKCSGHFP